VPSSQTLTNTKTTTLIPPDSATQPRMIHPFSLMYNLGGGNDNQHWITPFDLKLDCARIVLTTNNPASNTYALLAALTSTYDT